jgi:hypothetical protein
MNLSKYTLSLRHFLFLLILAVTSHAQQNFYLVSHSPHKSENHVRPATTIKLNFSQPVATNALPRRLLTVLGDVLGHYEGGLSFENENRTLCFTPRRPFCAGENVKVTLNRTLMSIHEQPLGRPYAFSFNVATSRSSLHFRLLKSISLENLPQPIQVSSNYDLNRDGLPDFVVGTNLDPNNQLPAKLAILRSIRSRIGEYTFEEKLSGISTCCFLVAPFDGDQYADLLALDYFGAALQFLKGKEDSFADYRTLCSWESPLWGEAADYDGDGDIDFAVASISTNISRGAAIFNNAGEADFQIKTVLQDGVPTRFVAWEDIDGDGLLDLLASSFVQNKFDLTVYLADNAGNFSTALHTALQDYTSYFQLRDLDLDEDLDLLAALPLYNQGRNDVSGRIAILVNDGKSTFSSRQMLVPQGRVPAFLDARDLDGDGDIDVACTNTGTISRPDSTVTFFLNDGAGNFVRANTLIVGRSPKGLRLIDINQDSRLDLAVVTVDPPALHLYLADTLASGIDDTPIPTTHRLALQINPNPFRDVVTIHLQAPINMAGELFIFDVLGRKVFSAPVQIRSEKETILWNGRDSSNRLAPSGIYFARLTVGAESASKKLLLLR